jgi:hypothetical protein
MWKHNGATGNSDNTGQLTLFLYWHWTSFVIQYNNRYKNFAQINDAITQMFSFTSCRVTPWKEPRYTCNRRLGRTHSIHGQLTLGERVLKFRVKIKVGNFRNCALSINLTPTVTIAVLKQQTEESWNCHHLHFIRTLLFPLLYKT